MLNEKFVMSQNNLERMQTKVAGYESEIIDLKKKVRHRDDKIKNKQQGLKKSHSTF